ncbi:DUF6415 family natural product biosynthesis protein [Streptomyces sp. NBC_01451]|uniref:DUF6415 family natural product biosynthesis protein n=1 Tax=Streptomyces sp. NBC_01451 TaxID=2903872 RepID=UPI002E37BDFD|nr:DUF6415 family natural product biosynthesis protein [Streptomyces sp. NBC_01451]
MANRITAASEGTERRHAARPDITIMRETVQILLDPDAVVLPPAPDELETLTQTIRGHLELLIPEVEQSVRLLKKDSIPRYCALACVGEARGKLRAEPSRRFGAEVGYARRLARTLNALCDHYENLGEHP